MRRLQVMRHAKSDWSAGTRDHERPLNDRGVRSAEAMGRTLTELGEVPDIVFCSTAVRAATTIELAAAAGGWVTEVQHLPSLYGTTVLETLEVVAGAPEVKRVMIVGHQPTWGTLVNHLTGGVVAVKTATVVGIDLAIDEWSEASDADGEISYVLQPRLFLD